MTYRLSTWAVLMMLLTFSVAGCHKDLLDREGGDVRLSYTLPQGVDFGSSIDTMRWLLYNESGLLLRELNMHPRQQQYLTSDELPEGKYTVVNIGNQTTRSVVDGLNSLSQLAVQANTQTAGGWYENTDHLFWQMRHFTVSGSQTVVELPLADVHCHLHVHVVWQGLPRQQGDWTLRLYGVPLSFQGGIPWTTRGGAQHPLTRSDTRGEHRISVRMLNYELQGIFTTFRWTSDCVPTLQVWCDDGPASPRLDLQRAFQQWGWNPDRIVAQDFWLEVTINGDDSADVRASSRLGVADWIDGGTL